MSFTPICISVDGLLGPHTVSFMKRLADHIVDDTQKPYSRVIYWLRAKLGFAILRATGLCIRGTRYKVKSIDSIDSVIYF